MFLQEKGDLVDAFDISDGDDLLILDLAASGNLLDSGLVESALTTASNL